MTRSGFALLVLLICISKSTDSDALIADCKNARLFADKCDACEGAPFDSGLKDVIPCEGKAGNGDIKKGVCVPRGDHWVCKAACMYEKDDVCSNMVPDTKKPPEFLGIGDSCCRGKRPICCGRMDGRNFKGAVCKENQSLADVMELTGAEDPSEIQACCHREGRDPWPSDSRHHIIWKNDFYACQKNDRGKLEKVVISRGDSTSGETDLSNAEESSEINLESEMYSENEMYSDNEMDLEEEIKSSPKDYVSDKNIYTIYGLNFPLFILALVSCFLLIRMPAWYEKAITGYAPLEAAEEI